MPCAKSLLSRPLSPTPRLVERERCRRFAMLAESVCWDAERRRNSLQTFKTMRSVANPQDKTAILARLSAVRPQAPARWGRMSAHQMVCHLGDSLRMVTGEKEVRQSPSLIQRTIVKWVVLYVPFRWPAGLPTSPEI